MDLQTQSRIRELADDGDGLENVIALLGAPDPESAELSALTVTAGDPTFAGPLAGVQLGLPVFHVLEEQVEAAADAATYDEEVSLMKIALDADAIATVVQTIRAQHTTRG